MPSKVGSSFAGSCNIPSASCCIDYNGSAYMATGTQQACSQSSGSYSSSPCSSTGAAGKCTQNGGQSTETVTYWYDAANLSTYETACTSAAAAGRPSSRACYSRSRRRRRSILIDCWSGCAPDEPRPVPAGSSARTGSSGLPVEPSGGSAEDWPRCGGWCSGLGLPTRLS